MNRDEFKAPDELKYRVNDSKNIQHQKNDVDIKLMNLAGSKWWFYTYFHDDTDVFNVSGPQLMRRLLIIKDRLANNDFRVEVPSFNNYGAYEGAILRKYSNGNLLTINLEPADGRPKSQDIRLHSDIHGKDELYIGMYLRHNENSVIRAGTVILERIKSEETELPTSKIYTYHTQEIINDVCPEFQEYFALQNLNMLRTPTNLYSKADFERWLRHQREYEPIFDFFVSVPIRWVRHSSKRRKEFSEELRSLTEELCIKNPDLETKIMNLVDNYFLNYGDYPKFTEDVLNMLPQLKEKSGMNRVFCPLSEDSNFTIDYPDPKTLLKEQFQNVKQSLRFILILPFAIQSSIFTQIGWAMARENNIPIFIFYRSEEDLPVLLRKADTLCSNRIFMEKLDNIGGIAGIPEWIVGNNYHKLPVGF